MSDGPDIVDFKRRLATLLFDTETLAFEMRTVRGTAEGLDKTRLRKAANSAEAATKDLLAGQLALAATAPWTARPIGADEWEYSDGTRVRAILQHRARGWVVHRVDSRGKVGGCDSFKTKPEAVDFITNGRIFRVA